MRTGEFSGMERLLYYKQEIVSLVTELGRMHSEIGDILLSRHPGEQGRSEISISQFCSEFGIHYRTQCTDVQLDIQVCSAVLHVGNYYERKTIHGLLRSEGVHVS